MASESCTSRRRRSKGIKNQVVPISEFGIAVLAIAEARRKKPADWLAGLIGITPQAANRLIRGKRRAPWLAFAARMESQVFDRSTGADRRATAHGRSKQPAAAVDMRAG